MFGTVVTITAADGTKETVVFKSDHRALKFYYNVVFDNRSGKRCDAAATLQTSTGRVIQQETFTHNKGGF